MHVFLVKCQFGTSRSCSGTTKIVSEQQEAGNNLAHTTLQGQKTTSHQLRGFLKSKIKVSHLNIRSLKNRDHLIQLRLLACEKNFDILALSESWLSSTATNAEVELEGYKLFRQDRLKKRGGGVCVYIKTSLKTKALKELSVISNSGFQQFWLQIQHKNLKPIILCVV